MAGKKSNEIAEKKLKTLQEQTGKIAHEVSQPLQVLSMVLSQIEHGVVKPENVKRGLRMIEKIVELTDELKNIAAENGIVELETEQADEQSQKGATSEFDGKKILIVDDNVDIVDMMIENFRLIGYHCEGAADGETAIPLVENNTYDLIISDLLMPRMSGKQLFETVQEMDYKGKFLFLTGYVVSEELQQVVEKADGILYKPFQLEELFKWVKEILE